MQRQRMRLWVEAQKNLTAQQAGGDGRTATGADLAQPGCGKRLAKNGPEQVKEQQAMAAQSRWPTVKAAQARVDQAKLNLSYTRVVAPTDGIVNKKNVEVGGNLSVGQDLLTIVPLNDLWVTANFKETQLNKMHRCEEVSLKVDALGGKTFSGKITQIGGATGRGFRCFRQRTLRVTT